MDNKTSGVQSQLDDFWEDLVLSILSVNNYSIEKTYKLVSNLREQGLLDPRKIIGSNHQSIFNRLNAGGYARGDYVNGLLAERLVSLGEQIQKRGVETFRTIISSKNAREIQKLLTPIKGVGPKVLSTFFFLRGIQNM
jgi:endonuclease III-like uncharacterized protein